MNDSTVTPFVLRSVTRSIRTEPAGVAALLPSNWLNVTFLALLTDREPVPVTAPLNVMLPPFTER